MGPALREWHDHPEVLGFLFFFSSYIVSAQSLEQAGPGPVHEAQEAVLDQGGAAGAGATACVGPLDCIFAIHLEAAIMAPVLAITLYKQCHIYSHVYNHSITATKHHIVHTQSHTLKMSRSYIQSHIVTALGT